MTEQLEQVLAVVGDALGRVKSSHLSHLKHRTREEEQRQTQMRAEKDRQTRIKRGTYHDGRIDCIAGNGIMSELGVGDEMLGDWDADAEVKIQAEPTTNEKIDPTQPQNSEERRQKSTEDVQAVETLPILVLRNFESTGGGKDEVLDVLSHWAAGLADGQVKTLVLIICKPDSK